MSNDPPDPQPALEEWKDRELEILRLIAQGHSNREIAETLFLSTNTIRWYNKQIYSKLDVHSRTEAVARARAWGLLDTDMEAPAAASPTRAGPPHNLPAQQTPFIGRERELAELTDRFRDPATRLLSIVGPGGIGKTRLALELARRLLSNFPDGVFFVPLQPLSAADDLFPAVAAAIGYSFREGSDPRRQVFDRLREAQMLLVLDNFEHLLDAAGEVSEMLQNAPLLNLLTTSRERLNLHEETLAPLEGLRVSAGTGEGEGEAEAVRLFLLSAQRARTDFRPGRVEIDSIVEICRLVDGMPLALELAAAWIEVLSPQEIAAEIQRSLDFLETEMVNLPDRHRSIRSVFDGAWKRLSSSEQEVFACLAVFRGGFTRPAAEIVAGADLRSLASLVSKSLLRRDPERIRFGIHELLRQYAKEQLSKQGSAAKAAEAHAAYFSSFVRERGEVLEHSAEPRILAELGEDFENVRAAWAWAVEQDHADLLAEMLEGVYQFTTRTRRYPAGLRMLDQALERANSRPGALPAETLARLRMQRGAMRSIVGLFDEAVEDLNQARDDAQQHGDRQRERDLLIALGYAYRNADRLEEAWPYLNEALEVSSEVGGERGRAETLYHLGSVVWADGDNRTAEGYHRESLEITRRLGLDDRVAMLALHGMSEIAWASALPVECASFAHESLEIARRIGDVSFESENLQNLGWSHYGILGTGDYGEGLLALEKSLALCREAHLWHMGPTLHGIGFGRGAMGDYAAGLEINQAGTDEAERLGQARYATAGYSELGHLLQDLNLLERAEAVHAEGVRIAHDSGTGFWLPRLEANWAIDKLRLGETAAAGELLKQALASALENRQLLHAVRCLEGLAEWALAAGDPALASDYADHLAGIADPGEMRELSAQARRWRGEALLLQDEPQAAERELRQAADLAATVQRPRMAWEIHEALARVYTALDDEVRADDHRAHAAKAIKQIRDGLPDELSANLPAL